MFDPVDDMYGTWYVNRKTGKTFSVVGFERGQVQIQMLDGDVAEISLREWHSGDFAVTTCPIVRRQSHMARHPRGKIQKLPCKTSRL